MPLCYGCMNRIDDTVCPNCYFDNSQQQEAPYLPHGTILQERYVTGIVLESNGESTRYIAYDRRHGTNVTIQEFLPLGLFERETGETELTIPVDKMEAFGKIQYEYSQYFKALQRLKGFYAIIKIIDIFEENNTTYLVEQNENLKPFEAFVDKNGGHLDWEAVRPMFMPIITAMEALHKLGYGHYGISPSNLYVTSLGKIKLSGFATEYARKRGTLIKAQLFNGCSAPEQYERSFVLDKTTDIYGFCATLFYALTGVLPKNAQERLTDSRLLMSNSTVKRIPPHVITALANGLNIGRESRTPDFEELRNQLSAAQTVQAIQDEISRTASLTSVKSDKVYKKAVASKRTTFIATLAVSLIVFSVIGYLWYQSNPFQSILNPSNEVIETTAPNNDEWTGPVVPEYVGESFDEVVSRLTEDEKLVVYKAEESEYSDIVGEGKIISQIPAAGTPIYDAEGKASVTVTVSAGKMNRELPDINNKVLSDVAEILSNAGFLVEKVPEYGNYGENRVIGYSEYQAGDKVKAGTLIRIRVCAGQPPTNP